MAEIQADANLGEGDDYIEYALISSSVRPVAVFIIEISIFALSIFWTISRINDTLNLSHLGEKWPLDFEPLV